MRNIFTIAGRELRAYFTSPMAYVVMVLFLFFSGLIFSFMIGQQQPRAELRGLFGSMVFLSMMVVPFITMSLIAQERSSGTVELLLTKPVHDRDVVLGKFLSALGMYTIMILFTLPYPIMVSQYGDLDWGPVGVGYLGFFLCAAAFIAVGTFASSLTRSQMAAAGICLGIFLFTWLIGWVSYLIPEQTSLVAELTRSISIPESFNDFEKGLLDSRNVIYLVSVMVFFLFLTVRVLEMRRQV